MDFLQQTYGRFRVFKALANLKRIGKLSSNRAQDPIRSIVRQISQEVYSSYCCSEYGLSDGDRASLVYCFINRLPKRYRILFNHVYEIVEKTKSF